MPIRVLMVDDDSVHLELSERFLNRQSPDYEIITVETSEEAIKLLEADGFDAAVCDIDLAKDSIGYRGHDGVPANSTCCNAAIAEPASDRSA